ncbi:MAG TPA: alanine--tRNA ligase [Rickettsiales bacterium]|nr:alanine--tRNA ligase [Rickettsiales bacterium]
MKHSLNDIRSTFLDFFARNGHEKVASSSLVPHNDPTLMFTNAGMVQFKNVFTGMEKRPYSRAATSQKCVRAGGKHNDLDNVGYTARHHTFFEMLGNFSFGDYFKDRAIELAWKLVTEEFGLPKEKLCVTVYHTDDEAFNLWKKIAGLPESKIIRIPTNDNFWSMGDTGPCGPCSEIFYDHGESIPGGPPGSPDEDGDRFIEIWNLVFMQYEQVDKDTRNSLPKPSIDTGMGLERTAAVIQGVHNNYDIDLFRHLIEASQHESRNANPDQLVSHRVIADHLRSTSFLIADGVMPSNEGRGYVLRRIMRRAMRHAHHLGCKEPLMYRLVPALVHEMGEHYPELSRAQVLITETLRLEEERFRQTLDRGLKLLEDETSRIASGGTLAGDVAFKLYDTYGFPLDLTQDILRGQGKTVDTPGFEKSMLEQKERARAAWSGSGDKATGRIWFEIKEKVGPTEFLGYAQDTGAAELLAIVVDGQEVSEAAAGTEATLIFNQTPFYGESGGQMGDKGIVTGNTLLAEISDTQKPLENFHTHKALLKAAMKVGDRVTLSIDTENRDRMRANHSATHILHAVMRRQLGEHITQRGSLVAPDKLRFDVSHPKALTKEEIAAVENEVNRIVWQNSQVSTRLMTPDEAVKQGAMALFGEKYGDEVRVVSMGLGEGPQSYSVELCGGTHVRATGDIGMFKIVSEAAVAAGIRRIEAVTRDGAFAYLAEQDARMRDMAQQFKTTAAEVPEKITALMNERKKLEKELAEVKKQLALGDSKKAEPENVGGLTFLGMAYEGLDPKQLRDVANNFVKQVNVVLASTCTEDKASIVIGVNKEVLSTVTAIELIQKAVEVVGGKGGGGKPDMAQGGGPDGHKLQSAITAVKELVRTKGENSNK